MAESVGTCVNWLCTFSTDNNQVCGKCFSTPDALNHHARLAHTKVNRTTKVGSICKEWWCGTCCRFYASAPSTHYKLPRHINIEQLRRATIAALHIPVNNSENDQIEEDIQSTEDEDNISFFSQLFNSIDNENQEDIISNITVSDMTNIVSDPVFNIYATHQEDLETDETADTFIYEADDTTWQTTRDNMTDALYLIVALLNISIEKFVTMCSILSQLPFSSEDVPSSPRVWFTKMFQFKKNKEDTRLENKGPIPVAPIYKYKQNHSLGFIVDMIYTLQYHILAHPERSSYIKKTDSTFRPDDMIQELKHLEVHHSCAMLATRRLRNEYGEFKHGHLVSYNPTPQTIKLGIILTIAQNEINAMDVQCSVQTCIFSQQLPQNYQEITHSNTQELYITEIIEHIPFTKLYKPEVLLSFEEWKALDPNERENSYFCRYKIYFSYHCWLPYNHTFPEPACFSEDVITIPIKWHIDGAPIATTVSNSYNFSFWIPACFPLDMQSKLHNSFLFGSFEKGFPLFTIASLLLEYFYNWFHKGIRMYHATLKRIVTIRCVLIIVLTDQPMGNALTGIRHGGATNGNRHYYHSSDTLHLPINLNYMRDEVADENQRQILYNNLIQNEGSRNNREKLASKIGISEASYSTQEGTPFYKYFETIGLRMYRSFPNCTLHVIYLNVASYILTLLIEVLNAEGRRLLSIAAQSDLLPDDFGSNTNKSRLRKFPEYIKSLVGGDISTLLPRLPVLFRLVLQGKFIKEEVKQTLFINESAGDYLSIRIFVRLFTCAMTCLEPSEFQKQQAKKDWESVLKFRTELYRIFTEESGKPSGVSLEVLASIAARFYSGSGEHISTANFEHKITEPKRTTTNQKDVALIITSKMTLKQALQAAYTGSCDSLGNHVFNKLANITFGGSFLGIKEPDPQYSESTDWLDFNYSPLHVYGGVRCSTFCRNG